MPLGVGISVWTITKGGGSIPTYSLDFSKARNSMYIPLIYLDF